MAANLHMTKKRAAELMNVSVRMVYEAQRLSRAGRPDLVAQVDAGTLSLHRALILAGVKKAPSKAAALSAAWVSASNDERDAFLAWLKGSTL